MNYKVKMITALKVGQFMLLVFCSSMVLGQSSKSMVRKAYSVMESISKQVNEDHILNLKFSITTVSNLENGAQQEEKSNISLLADGSRIHFVSEEVEIVQDLENSVVVLPIEKAIYLMKPENKDYKAAVLSKMNVVNEKVLERSSVSTHQPVTTENGKGYRIVLVPDSAIQREFNIKEIEYILEADKGTLKEHTVFYADGHSVHSVSMIMNSLNVLENKKQLPSNALSVVFDQQKPKSKYQSYTIYDVRTNQ